MCLLYAICAHVAKRVLRCRRQSGLIYSMTKDHTKHQALNWRHNTNSAKTVQNPNQAVQSCMKRSKKHG